MNCLSNIGYSVFSFNCTVSNISTLCVQNNTLCLHFLQRQVSTMSIREEREKLQQQQIYKYVTGNRVTFKKQYLMQCVCVGTDAYDNYALLTFDIHAQSAHCLSLMRQLSPNSQTSSFRARTFGDGDLLVRHGPRDRRVLCSDQTCAIIIFWAHVL